MKKLILIAFIAFGFYNCSNCEECYLSETHINSGTTVVTPIGEYCDQELADIDGTFYIAIDGSATLDCN